MIHNIRNIFYNLTGLFIKKRKNILHKLVWLCCFSICIPTVISGMAYYKFSTSQSEQQALEHSQSNLMRLKDRVEGLLKGIEKDSIHLTTEPLLNDALIKPDLNKDYFISFDLLERKKSLNSLVQEIAFYRKDDEYVFSSDLGHVRKDDYPFYSDLEILLKSSKQNGWIQLPEGTQKNYLTFSRLVQSSSDGGKYGILIYEVEIPVLQSYLQDMSGWFSSLYVLDNQNKVLFGSSDKDTNKMITPQVVQMLSNNDMNGSRYIHGNNGSTLLYTYVWANQERIYLSATPNEIITNEFAWIRWLVALVVSVVIICGVCVSLFNLLRIYNPIEQLVRYGEQLGRGRVEKKGPNEVLFIKECLRYLKEESDRISQYVARIKPTAMEKYLQMILEWNPLIRLSLESDCKFYQIDIDGPYGVMVFDIEDFHKEDRFLRGDQPIVAFALMNIMKELLESGKYEIEGYILESGDGKVAAILHSSKETAEDQFVNWISGYAADVQKTVTDIMKLKVSVGIGKIYSHIADVSISYQEASTALQRRIYGMKRGILYAGDTNHETKSVPQLYPDSLQEQIIEALRIGDKQKALENLEKFLEKIQPTENPNFIFQSYHILLSALLTSLQSEGGSVYQVLSEYALFDELRERQTSSEIYDWFTSRLFPLYSKIISKEYENKGTAAVLQICKYVREHVLDNPSLVQCSELVSMSPAYISHIFKSVSGMSFIEYVTQCKLEESKKMLTNSDMNHGEIAEAIGFSERHFLRFFQKHMDMSPRQYRALNR